MAENALTVFIVVEFDEILAYVPEMYITAYHTHLTKEENFLRLPIRNENTKLSYNYIIVNIILSSIVSFNYVINAQIPFTNEENGEPNFELWEVITCISIGLFLYWPVWFILVNRFKKCRFWKRKDKSPHSRQSQSSVPVIGLTEIERGPSLSPIKVDLPP